MRKMRGVQLRAPCAAAHRVLRGAEKQGVCVGSRARLWGLAVDVVAALDLATAGGGASGVAAYNGGAGGALGSPGREARLGRAGGSAGGGRLGVSGTWAAVPVVLVAVAAHGTMGAAVLQAVGSKWVGAAQLRRDSCLQGSARPV
mmetsp:Transcript_29369/g.76187  ORF Transcript_29369/g.76187 Transcript_29369/m.76187 type:complete len:145 (+) Transcript_29369:233-667(+)